VSPSTTSYLQTLLGNDTGDYLAGVATWADSVRYTKWGRFSADFHFIDAKDSPPSYCGVEFDRDCKKDRGCVVSALQNYTTRLLDASLPDSEHQIAAKFVVHFVGDVHQPLHTEDVDRGGNGIQVHFGGQRVNLHHVWDTSIVEKMVSGAHRSPFEAAQQWAGQLATEIQSGKFAGERDSWVAGISLSDPIGTVLTWATGSNAYVCTTGECFSRSLTPSLMRQVFGLRVKRVLWLTRSGKVMPEGPEAIRNQELGSDYYDAAAPVVEVQIARAGYRLAAWLDLIVSSIHGQSSPGDL
jgi:hypothetical protein